MRCLRLWNSISNFLINRIFEVDWRWYERSQSLTKSLWMICLSGWRRREKSWRNLSINVILAEPKARRRMQRWKSDCRKYSFYLLITFAMRPKKWETFFKTVWWYEISNHCRIKNSKDKILKNVPKKLLNEYKLKLFYCDVENRVAILQKLWVDIEFVPQPKTPYNKVKESVDPFDKYRRRDARRKERRREWNSLTREQQCERNLMSD